MGGGLKEATRIQRDAEGLRLRPHSFTQYSQRETAQSSFNSYTRMV